MYMHCTFCGSTQLEKNRSGHQHCTDCWKMNFINTACSSWCFLIDSAWNVGLAKRAHEPRKGKYDEAWWFVDPIDESCEIALIRELQEELGILVTHDQLNYLTSHIMFYPFQWRETPVMCMIYYAYVSDTQKDMITVNDDVESFHRVDKQSFDPDMMCSPLQGELVLQLLDL